MMKSGAVVLAGYLGKFQSIRISCNRSIFITIASIGHKLRIPNSIVALSRFALAENRRRRSCYRNHHRHQ